MSSLFFSVNVVQRVAVGSVKAFERHLERLSGPGTPHEVCGGLKQPLAEHGNDTR